MPNAALSISPNVSGQHAGLLVRWAVINRTVRTLIRCSSPSSRHQPFRRAALLDGSPFGLTP
jgi:hypothetical protein